jgi:hypothetical protein
MFLTLPVSSAFLTIRNFRKSLEIPNVKKKRNKVKELWFCS